MAVFHFSGTSIKLEVLNVAGTVTAFSSSLAKKAAGSSIIQIKLSPIDI